MSDALVGIDPSPPRQDRPPPTRRPAAAARPTFRQRLARLDVKASPYAYIAPFFLIFAVAGLFPLLYTVYVSLFNWDVGDDNPTFVGLKNYTDLLADNQFWHALVNTVSIFLLSSVPQVAVAVVLAVLLNARLRAATGWRMAVLLPYVLSLVAVGIVFGNLFGQHFGLINNLLDAVGIGRIDWQANRFASHVAIATMVNWRWTGYNSLIVLAAMQAIPQDLHEAAMVDGAGTWRRFVSITLPMLRPTLIFVVVTSTIGGLQIFTEPKLFDSVPGSSNGGSQNQFQTITLYLYQSGFEQLHLGYASAMAWLLFLLIVAVALVNFLITRRLASSGKDER